MRCYVTFTILSGQLFFGIEKNVRNFKNKVLFPLLLALFFTVAQLKIDKKICKIVKFYIKIYKNKFATNMSHKNKNRNEQIIQKCH